MMKAVVIVVMIVYVIRTNVEGDFEVCNPGESTTVYQFTHEECPFGVLFAHPILVNCMASTNFPEYFLTDLCDPDRNTLAVNDPPYKIHLAFQMDPETVEPEHSCLGNGSDKCDVATVTQATYNTFTPPVEPGCNTRYDDVILAPGEEIKQIDYSVSNQTERLFKYMLGLIDDEKNIHSSSFRLVKLLKLCFRIFKKFSNTKFIPAEFGRDVLAAFLYLFHDSDLTDFKDISVDDFQIIYKTMINCENMEPPFKLIGRNCLTCANAYGIEKMGKTLRYKESKFDFVWRKYDIPTDATWNVITFVHGLCYGTYRIHVNYHHLYELEMEKLFTPEILYRWTRPTVLYHENLWDHIFSTSVKNAMRNLDVSIFGAYHDTPFLHRLERPIMTAEDTTPPSTQKRRNKRSILSTMSLDDGGLRGAGWCFQTEEDLVGTVTAYISYHCPDVPVPHEIMAVPEKTNVLNFDRKQIHVVDKNKEIMSDEFARQ